MTWQPINSAPKDGTKIIGWCDHEADPYWQQGDELLTTYAAQVESCGCHANDGVQILIWVGETIEYDEGILPAWWFVDDNGDWQYPANPTHWQPLPDHPPLEDENTTGADSDD